MLWVFLAKLKLENWRKFKKKNDGSEGLQVEFSRGLNLLVGENDSGKTAIIDAIKTTLGTNSSEKIWLTEDDFSDGTKNLRIDLYFQNLTEKEETYFFEWLTLPMKVGETSSLHVCLEAEIYNDINNYSRIRKTIKCGPDGSEKSIDDTIRQLLSVTYLKPLRDAQNELNAGNRSRISQIIQGLTEFSGNSGKKEQLVNEFQEAFQRVNEALKGPVIDRVKQATDIFFDDTSSKTPIIGNKKMGFQEILRKLQLKFDEISTGLGSSNLLFMALELILFEQEKIGLNLALVEEIEAHIHPQAQLRVMKYFEEFANTDENDAQYIFTTHSPILASSMPLESMIMVYNNNSYSMKKGKTKLEGEDYEFLERFLDATKANLFFSKGVIIVEGDAENIFLPTFADVIGFPLHKYGVSIVNVGNLAFKRYSRIFLRNGTENMNFPVSILTDLDSRSSDTIEEKAKRIENKKKNLSDSVEKTRVFLSKPWTFENVLLQSCLRDVLEDTILELKYSNEKNRKEHKDEWKKIENDAERADVAYKFMVDKKISKSIVAQKMAKYMNDNKEELNKLISADEKLSYLVDMIKHASGIKEDNT